MGFAIMILTFCLPLVRDLLGHRTSLDLQLRQVRPLAAQPRLVCSLNASLRPHRCTAVS
jgi:hypothetical protein